MKRSFFVIVCLTILSFQYCFAQQEKQEVLHLVDQFFDAMEKNDSVRFRNVFLPQAYNYYIQEKQDSIRVGGRSSLSFKLTPDRIIKERLLDTGVMVQIHKRIAMVWGPYDLWVNNKYSHCGVDVFTLLKTKAGWKIASLAFSMETEGCSPSGKE